MWPSLWPTRQIQNWLHLIPFLWFFSNAQFRRHASAVLNLIAVRFDSSAPEARL